MKSLAFVLSIVMTLPAASFAQRVRGMGGGMRDGRGGGRMRAGMDEQTALLLFSALLTLTDTQQQQLGAVFDAAVKTAAPLNTQIENGNNALFQAIKSGQTEDQTKTLSDKESSFRSQLLSLQTETFSKMCALLTADQKGRVDDSMFTNIGEFLANAREPLPETALPSVSPAVPTSSGAAPSTTPH